MGTGCDFAQVLPATATLSLSRSIFLPLGLIEHYHALQGVLQGYARQQGSVALRGPGGAPPHQARQQEKDH